MDFSIYEVSSNELLEAQALVWSTTLSFIKSMSLKCAIELGIPDIIHSHGKPIKLTNLISSLQIHPSKSHCIHRLMAILVHSGFFKKIQNNNNNQNQDDDEQQEEQYSLTLSSQLLLKHGPFRAAPLSQLILDPLLVNPCHYLSTWLRNEDDASSFEMTNGKRFWDLVAEPRLFDLFYEAMASDSQIIANVIFDECKGVFEGLKSLVDVGGGNGALAKAIAKNFPEIDCFVLDLPHVVADLEGTDNLKFIVGNMFQTIPPANGILLKWILHDWNDEECVKILKQCKEALATSKDVGGKIMIIDIVVGNNKKDKDQNSTEAQLGFDMLMMVLLCSKERNEKEWESLFLSAGFSHYKITPIFGVRSLIEVYP